MSTPKQVIEMAKKSGAKMVDVKFVDTFGTWQHFTIPIAELAEDSFSDGLGFDGSSIRGWKSIEASDMLAMPDPASAFIDPFMAEPTLSLTCTIAETGTKEAYIRDPRGIAQRGEKYLQSTGIADTAVFGPEAEFFIFDDVRFDSKSNGTFYSIDGEEAIWNSGRDEMPNLGYKIRHKEGYFPVGPADTQQDIRTEMCLVMEKLGITVERQHHEVATAGQAEIDFRFDTLVKTADNMMLYKYIIKNVAKKHGKTATFMPKPLFGDNGSGMHTHQSLWKKNKPLFAGNEYAGLSNLALHYIGGILKHAKALCALCSPTTNSYKRCQSLSVLHGAADGRPGRCAEQDRPGRTDRQEHVRIAARRNRQGATDLRQSARGAGPFRKGPRVPVEGRRVHGRLSGNVDQPQTQGSRRHPAASAPL